MLKLQGTCPVCACGFTENDDVTICERCDQPHHADCYEYAGGCAIFGCVKAAVPAKRTVPDLNEGEKRSFLRGLVRWGTFIRWDGYAYILRSYAFLFLFVSVIISFSVFLLTFTTVSGYGIRDLSVVFVLLTSLTPIAFFVGLPVSMGFKFLTTCSRALYELLYIDVQLAPPTLTAASTMVELGRIQIPSQHYYFGDLACRFVQSFDENFWSVVRGLFVLRLFFCMVSWVQGVPVDLVGVVVAFAALLIPIKIFGMLIRTFSHMIKEHFHREALLISSFENRLAASIKKG